MFTIVRDLARQNMEFLCGLLLFAVIVGLIVVSYFSPYGATDIYLLPPDMPPDGEYWLGTTSRGQDVFWQLTTALRNTLFSASASPSFHASSRWSSVSSPVTPAARSTGC